MSLWKKKWIKICLGLYSHHIEFTHSLPTTESAVDSRFCQFMHKLLVRYSGDNFFWRTCWESVKLTPQKGAKALVAMWKTGDKSPLNDDKWGNVDKVLLIKREFTKSMLKSGLAKSLKVKQFFENPKNRVWINTCTSWIKKWGFKKLGTMWSHYSASRSSIPNPNKAKSYLTGSWASNCLKFSVNSSTACQSLCLRSNNP